MRSTTVRKKATTTTTKKSSAPGQILTKLRCLGPKIIITTPTTTTLISTVKIQGVP